MAVVCSAEFDISEAPPAEDSRLSVIVVFGAIKILVAHGTRVRTQGFSLFGGREAMVAPGEGPEVNITAVAFFGRGHHALLPSPPGHSSLSV